MMKVMRREEKKEKRKNEEGEEDVGFLFDPVYLRAQRLEKTNRINTELITNRDQMQQSHK